MTSESLLRGLKGLSAADMPSHQARPVDAWHPEFAAPIDIHIDRDGQWFHEGSPIARASLVALFASVLRREPDGQYVLVTPAEKRFITVDDVPFIGVVIKSAGEGQDMTVTMRTNLGEDIIISDEHPLELRENADISEDTALAYVRVRGGLDARLNRTAFQDLAELGTVEIVDSENWFGVRSSGSFWKLLPAEKMGL